MMNKIWCFMILAGLIVGSFNGKITTLSDTILSSSKEAVELCILMFGIVGLWSGLMNIALSLGITTQLQKLLTPFLTFLFPNLKNQKAKEYISTNIVANILGLGWAATPSGLKAMEELQKDNPDKNTATNEMCSFLILNISSLQLIPINIIAYRSQYGSVNPSKILIPGLIATLGSTIVAVIYIKWTENDDHISCKSCHSFIHIYTCFIWNPKA